MQRAANVASNENIPNVLLSLHSQGERGREQTAVFRVLECLHLPWPRFHVGMTIHVHTCPSITAQKCTYTDRNIHSV